MIKNKNKKLFTSILLAFLCLSFLSVIHFSFLPFVPEVYATPNVVTTVYTTSSTSATGLAYQTTPAYINGVYWLWYYSGTSNPNYYEVCATSLDGSTWTTQNYSYTNNAAGATNWGFWYNSTTNMVFYVRADSSNNLDFRNGTLNSDRTITWYGSEVTVASGKQWINPCIIQNSTGGLWISVTDNTGNNNNVYNATSSTGSTWSAATTLWTDSGYIQLVPLANGGIMALHSYSGSNVQSRLYTSGTWATSVSATTSVAIYGGFNAVADGNNVALAFENQTTQNVRFVNYTYGTGWEASEETVSTTGMLAANYGVSISRIGTNNYRVFYALNTTAIVYRDRTNNTWGSITVVSNSEVESTSVSVSLSSSINSASDFLCVAWVSGTSSLYQVRYVYFYLGSGELIPPTYSNVGWSSIVPGTSCKFSVLLTDNVAVSGFIFGSNNTGPWVNQTWTSSGSSTPVWANFTLTLNSTEFSDVQCEWWFNDTSVFPVGGNWNNTGVQNLFTSTTASLVSKLTTLVNSIDWNFSTAYGLLTDFDRILSAYQLGIYNSTQVANIASVLKTNETDHPAIAVMYAYSQLRKYGIENQSEIEWALDNITMMSNGLPDTGAMLGGPEPSCFSTYYRFLLWGYNWSQKYNYETSKWNLTKAYDSAKNACFINTPPPSSQLPIATYIFANSTAGIYYAGSGRYYDEAAETMDVFITFYQLGVTDALTQAVNIWNYINNNFWYSNSYWSYTLGSPSVEECELGGFAQIALKLLYYYPTLGNASRITKDLETRLLNNLWNSDQWSPAYPPNNYYNLYNTSSGMIIHAVNSNPEKRMENNLMAYSAIYADPYISYTDISNFAQMLKGYNNSWTIYAPAWQLLWGFSNLRDRSTNLFYRTYNPSLGYPSGYGGHLAASLLFTMGIVPGTGRMMISPNDMMYEDTNSLTDAGLNSINLNNYTVNIAISTPGTVGFIFGNYASYNFTQQGLYTVVFASNWNSISSVTFNGEYPLTTGRIFLSFTSSQTSIGSASITPARINANQNLTVTGTVFQNGTSIPPVQGTVTIYVSLSGTVKGSTTAYDPSAGNFTIIITGGNSLGSYSYLVYAIDGGASTQNQTVTAIVDRLDVTITADNVNPSGGVQMSANVTAVYHYDSTSAPLSAFQVQRNGTNYATSNFTDTEASGTVYNYTITSATDSTYGLNTFSSNTLTVYWETVIVKITAITTNTTRTGINQTASLSYSLTFGNNTVIDSGNLTINGTVYSIQSGGWVNFTYSNAAVGSYLFHASAVNASGVTLLSQIPSDPTIIYDNLIVTISSTSTTPQNGNAVVISWTVSRQYDNTFSSNFILNVTKDGNPWQNNTNLFSATDSDSNIYHIYSSNGVIDNSFPNITVFSVTPLTVTWSQGQNNNGTFIPSQTQTFTITIVVINASTPVVSVQVVISSQVVTTDYSGAASFTLAQGSYPITISSQGELLYSSSVAVSTPNQVITIDLSLPPPQPVIPPTGFNPVSLGIIVITVIIVLALVASQIEQTDEGKRWWKEQMKR